MTTSTIGAPSADAGPVQFEAWRYRAASTPPIHRFSPDSCPGLDCTVLELPAGLVLEIQHGGAS